MPQGLQIFDASGNIVLDISDRVYRLLTVADITTAATGSITVPGIANGTPIIVPVRYTESKKAPTLTTTGTGVSWNYGTTPLADRDANLRITVALF